MGYAQLTLPSSVVQNLPTDYTPTLFMERSNTLVLSSDADHIDYSPLYLDDLHLSYAKVTIIANCNMTYVSYCVVYGVTVMRACRLLSLLNFLTKDALH